MAIYDDERWLNWVDALSADDYVIIDDFLPEEIYQQAKKFFSEKLQEDQFEQAGLGSVFNNQINAAIRGDYTYWIDKNRDEVLSNLFQLIEEAIQIYNRYCYLSLSGYEFHFAYYPKGTFYKRHVDQFKDRSNRMISVIIYFNEAWVPGNGGELRIFKEEGEILIEPIAGRCIMFKSAAVPHEVTKTEVGRYSLTGWLLYQPSGVGFSLG